MGKQSATLAEIKAQSHALLKAYQEWGGTLRMAEDTLYLEDLPLQRLPTQPLAKADTKREVAVLGITRFRVHYRGE